MRAVLFDMDGVLVDTEQYFVVREPELLRRFAPRFADEELHSFTGMTVRSLHEYLVQRHGAAVRFDDFHEAYDSWAKPIYLKDAELFAGTQDCLAALRRANFSLGLVSSSPRLWIGWTLARWNLGEFFQVALSAEECANGKPAPDPYLLAASRLGIPPAECVVVEDSMNGVASGKAAGMRCIGFLNGTNTRRHVSHADWIVASLGEIPRVLEKANN